MTRKTDVQRILFSRNHEDIYTVEELYHIFDHVSPYDIRKMRLAISDGQWQFTPPEERINAPVMYHMMGTDSRYWDLFFDFRNGGYRLLGDIICDFDDMYRSMGIRKNLLDKKGDSQDLQFMLSGLLGNPNITSKSAADNCKILKDGFTREWKKKVRQMQVPAFALNTKGAWVLRFDDILADALELGPLQNYDISLPQETTTLLAERTPNGVPETLLPMLTKYYLAHLQEGEEWVVLPILQIAISSGQQGRNFRPVRAIIGGQPRT